MKQRELTSAAAEHVQVCGTLADWDTHVPGWRIDAETYEISAGSNSMDMALRGHAGITAAHLAP